MNRRFCSAQRVKRVAPGASCNAMSGTEIVGDVAGARGLRFDPDFILAAEPYPNNELTCLAFNNSWRKIFVWQNEKALLDTSNIK